LATENTNSRFIVTAAPEQAPGVDFITKSSIGPFIDTGYTVQFREMGRIYLSLETIREMAVELGLFDNLVSTPSADQLQAEYDRGYDNAQKENLIGNLRDLVDELGSVADRIAGPAGVVDDPTGDDVAATDAPSTGDLGAAIEADVAYPQREPVADAEAVREEPASAPEPDRQGNGDGRQRRRAGVSSSTGNDNPFRI
jgi:hypothetical protein